MSGLFFRAGYALESFSESALARAGRIRAAAGEVATRVAPAGAVRAAELVPDRQAVREWVAPVGSLLVGLAVSSAFRPKRVPWPRTILAGAVGAGVLDALERLERRPGKCKFGTTEAGPEPERPTLAARAARYASGVGMAVFYARYLRGRAAVPGVAVGAVYGALDAAAAPWGGLVPLLLRVHPSLDLSERYASVTPAGPVTVGSVARGAAFGAVVGAVVR